jgi:hypothetical protein
MQTPTAPESTGLTDAIRRNAATLAPVDLNDKYTSTSGTIYLSGIQALVRLPMIQRQRDLAAGIPPASFQAIADRRSAGLMKRSGRRNSCWSRAISSSSPASTRIWRQPRYGVRSKST